MNPQITEMDKWSCLWREINNWKYVDHQKCTKLPTSGWGCTVPGSEIVNGCRPIPTKSNQSELKRKTKTYLLVVWQSIINPLVFPWVGSFSYKTLADMHYNAAKKDSRCWVPIDYQTRSKDKPVDIKQKVTCSEEVSHLQRAERST
jgi:hypothetical protein